MKDSFTKKLLDKRKKVKPKFQINDLIRIADLKKTFSKGVTLKWADKLYKTTEIINKTIALITLTIYQNVIRKLY